MTKRRMEGDFKRGSKTSSSLMATDAPDLTDQWMATAFYLPVDILKNPDWEVMPISVITGEDFYNRCYNQTAYCVEDVKILLAAQYVVVSHRINRKTGKHHIVAKLWYGEAP